MSSTRSPKPYSLCVRPAGVVPAARALLSALLRISVAVNAGLNRVLIHGNFGLRVVRTCRARRAHRGRPLVHIVFQVAVGLSHAAGLLRGLDDTRSGFRITLIGYWAVGLPASWLLAHPLGLDTPGIWLGLLIGLATTAVLLLRRYSDSLSTHARHRRAVAEA